MAEPSWAVLDQTDVYHPFRLAKLQADYHFWRAVQPIADVDSDEDWTTVTTLVHNSTGLGRRQVTRCVDALEVLDRLPRLRALVEATHLLDMNHLSVIEGAVRKAPLALQEDEYFWSSLDDDLMCRFTPSRPRQLLPGKRAITDTVLGAIRSVEHRAAPKCEDPWGAPTVEEEEEGPRPCGNPAELMSTLPPVEDDPTSELYLEDLAGGDVRIELIVDQATGTRIIDAIEQVASEQDCSRAAALTALILDNITTKVTTLLYSVKNVEDSPVHHPDRGILTDQAAAALRDLSTRTLDMDEARTGTTAAYPVTERIRAYLIGRDWTCRWPGCSRRARHCDADHRINFADGGPTSPDNMVLLCRHHHNRKTDQQAFYLLDPVTGEVYWLFADGSWVVDETVGPLAPTQKRWVQTYRQRRERRRERLAAQAAAERFDTYREKMNTPPPVADAWMAPQGTKNRPEDE